MSAVKRLVKCCRGQALVEMAFVLPVLLLLLFGIIEFGRVFNAYLVTAQASREGARVAALGAGDAEIIAAVRNAAETLEEENLAVSIEPAYPRARGEAVTVRVLYTLDIYAPIITAFIPDPFTVSAKTVMRAE